MTYEYLISGLDDLQVGQKSKLPFDELLLLLEEQMSPADFSLIEQLRKRQDAPDVVALMEDDAVQDRFHETSLSEEDFRTQLLYEQGMKSRNKFIRAWYEFNLNLNNVMAAVVCQKHGYDPEKVIVGDNEVAQLLRKGNLLKNAGLAAALPELKEIVAVSEIQNLLDRERHIDALRWQWLEEYTRFMYFRVENVLAYYLQAEILHRWDDLTREQGEVIFRQLLADMKKDIKF
ncbi:MAG: DUF2764 family protein [Paludibacteraceae bacterium]|nr:DUF2764 family protein [Paludibacteraceae bacterium]